MRPIVPFLFIAGCCMADTADIAVGPVVPAEKKPKQLPTRVLAMEAPLNNLVEAFTLRPLNAALPEEEELRESAAFDVKVGRVIKRPPKVVATVQEDQPKIIVPVPEPIAPTPKGSAPSVKPLERSPVLTRMIVDAPHAVPSTVTVPPPSVQTDAKGMMDALPSIPVIPSVPAKFANPSITKKESPSVKKHEDKSSQVISDPVLSVLKMLQEDLPAEDDAKVNQGLAAAKENPQHPPKNQSEKRSNGFLLKTYQLANVKVGESGKLREIQQLLNGLLPEGSSVVTETKNNNINVLTTEKAHGGVMGLLSKIDILESRPSPASVPQVDEQIVAKTNAVLQNAAENAMRLEKIEGMIRSIESTKVPASGPAKPIMAPILDWEYRYHAAGAGGIILIVAIILWWRNRQNKRRLDKMAAEQLKDDEVKRIAEAAVVLATAKLERGQKGFIDQVNTRVTAMETDVREQRIQSSKQSPALKRSSSAGIERIPFGHNHPSIGLQLELPLKL